VVVTVRVADAEEYRLSLTDADDLATARKLLAGDTDVEVGYSWHIDPASVEFADTNTEV
jgi:hypothetical protein